MYIFWAIAGIVFLYLDLVKTNAYKLTFASASLFCAVIAFKFPQNYLYQVYSFAVFSMLFYFLIKTTLKKEQKDFQKEKTLGEYIGKRALVVKDIAKTLSIDGIGHIKYKGKIWQAKSIDDKEIKAGKKVEIVSKENKIMNVRVVK